MEVGGLIRSTKISSSCCYNNNNKQAAESSQVLQHKLGSSSSSSGALVVSQTAASSIPKCLHKVGPFTKNTPQIFSWVCWKKGRDRDRDRQIFLLCKGRGSVCWREVFNKRSEIAKQSLRSPQEMGFLFFFFFLFRRRDGPWGRELIEFCCRGQQQQQQQAWLENLVCIKLVKAWGAESPKENNLLLWVQNLQPCSDHSFYLELELITTTQIHWRMSKWSQVSQDSKWDTVYHPRCCWTQTKLPRAMMQQLCKHGKMRSLFLWATASSPSRKTPQSSIQKILQSVQFNSLCWIWEFLMLDRWEQMRQSGRMRHGCKHKSTSAVLTTCGCWQLIQWTQPKQDILDCQWD